MYRRVGIVARVKCAVFMLGFGSAMLGFFESSILGQSSVPLSWNPSPDPNVIGYNIYYGVASGAYTSMISAGNSTNLTVPGLVAGVTYYFAATAYDSLGEESDFSNEASYNVPATVISTSNLQSGSYGGLFCESDAVRLQSAGAFTLSVTAGGKYSGLLQMTTARLPFSGQFGSLCQTTNYVKRKNTNTLVVNFVLNPSNQVTGVVSDGAWTANLYGERMGIHPTTNSPPYPGKYTLMIHGNALASSSLGNGFGTLTLSTAGAVRFAGTLADGTKLSQSAAVTQFGNWPFYIPLYSGQGLVMGWLSFTNSASGVPAGAFNWIKSPNPKSALYRNGLAIQTIVKGSFYVPPPSPGMNVAMASLTILGAAAPPSGTNEVLSLKFSPSTGTFTGRVMNQTTGKPEAFEGAFLQAPNAGYGFVLGTNLSSPLILIP